MQWQDTAGHLLNSFARYLSLRRNAQLPFIPNELIEIIFTMAAASSRECCKALCLVATWSRQMVLPYLRQTIILSKPSHYEQFMIMLETYTTSRLMPHTFFTEKLWIGRAAFTSEEQVASFPSAFLQFPSVKHLTLIGDCFDAVLDEAAKTCAFSNGPDLHVTVLEPYLCTNTYPRPHRHIAASQFSHRITHLYLTSFEGTYDECSVAALTNVKELVIHTWPCQVHAFRRMLPPPPLADVLEKYILILGPDPVWDSPSMLFIDENLPLTAVIPEIREQKPCTLIWHREEPECWEDEVEWNWDAAIKYTAQFDM